MSVRKCLDFVFFTSIYIQMCQQLINLLHDSNVLFQLNYMFMKQYLFTINSHEFEIFRIFVYILKHDFVLHECTFKLDILMTWLFSLI